MKFRYHYPQLLLLLAAAKFLTAPINPRDNQRRGGLSFNFPSKALYCVISCVVPQREVTSANRESLSPPFYIETDRRQHFRTERDRPLTQTGECLVNQRQAPLANVLR